jgi:hypothetical protein
MNVISRITAFVVACAGVFTSQLAQSQTYYSNKGLGGYIEYGYNSAPLGYGAGMSFYTAVWPLSESSLKSLQVGLASSWIVPDNIGVTTALAPPGSFARENMPAYSPTWLYAFQTLDIGIGIVFLMVSPSSV